MDGLANNRGLDPATIVALSRFTGHELNIALARRTAVRYAYRLLADDGAAIAACDTRGVVSDGIAFAGAAIREWLDDHAPD